ncbi:unnamed protein product [Dracunculus medinensis]|uniref:Rad60-SLD_2 domain-containing protein n=1 Tax=Dracunculus medinensis TaxID=318479 RepID=A0A0N4UGV5_DRAME|nr:unnamed protein product [Dracunculus medinensis]
MMDWSDDEDFVNEGSGSGEESPVLAPSSREPVIVRITTKITEPWKIVKDLRFELSAEFLICRCLHYHLAH